MICMMLGVGVFVSQSKIKNIRAWNVDLPHPIWIDSFSGAKFFKRTRDILARFKCGSLFRVTPIHPVTPDSPAKHAETVFHPSLQTRNQLRISIGPNLLIFLLVSSLCILENLPCTGPVSSRVHVHHP